MPSKEKKNIKKAEKRVKELKDILKWMDIQKIDDQGLHLKSGHKVMVSKGYRLDAFNILLADSQSKAHAIIAWASGLDKDKFPIYYKFIKSTPRLQYHQSELSKKESVEENPGIKAIMRMQLAKMEWFCENQKEVAFYVMVKDDYEHIEKKLEQLYYTYSSVGLNPQAMTVSDYESVVKEQFENETVNEYMFSSLLKDEEVYNHAINKK